MAKTVNELISELQRKVAFKLTSADISIKFRGSVVEITPILCGENGDYWCELYIKKRINNTTKNL